MKLDDETLLSAYLDDELDEAQRLRVEEALLADPRLAQQLRELALMRDLVAGLGRPAPAFDLSASVLDWVGDRRPGRPLRQRLAGHWPPRPRWLLVASGLTAAAGVLIAATLAIVLGPTKPVASPWSPAIGLPTASSAAPTTGSVRAAEAGPAPADSPASGTLAARSPVSDEKLAEGRAVAPVADLDLQERKGEDDRQFLLGLLNRPDVRRILIGVDAIDDAAGKVGTILQQTGRKHPLFGRLSVGQGIVLDPDRPGRAVVFAFVADDPERKLLVSQITTQLGDSADVEVEDRPLDARVRTQLAGAGPLEVFEGERAATLGAVPEDLKIALKHRRDEDDLRRRQEVTTAAPDLGEAQGAAGLAGGPTRSRASRPAALDVVGPKEDALAPGRTAEGRDAAPARPASREPVTVLVWVTSRMATRSGLR